MIYDLIESISDIALSYSKRYDTVSNYAYAYGYFKSQIQVSLTEMDLTTKQIEILKDSIKRMQTLSQ